MKRTSALSGLIGLVLLLFGILGYLLTGGAFASLFAGLNVVAGVFAIIGWMVSSRGTLGTMAGARSTRYGTNAAVYSVAFIGVLIAINYLGVKHHRQFDLTANRAFSLSPQSLSVIKSLKHPLKLYGFVEAGNNPEAQVLYGQYAYQSPLITYELVDPTRHPELAERFKVAVMNTTHIQYNGDAGAGTNVTDLTEEAITNAILKVTHASQKTVCFIAGEGEDDPDDSSGADGMGQFKDALQGESYVVKKVDLVTEAKMPEDCAVTVVAGPERPLVPHVIEVLNDYADGGGRLLVMMRPPRPDQTSDETTLAALMLKWGVNAGNNVVVDQVVRLFAGPALGLNPTVNSYGAHPITASFDKQTVFPMARTVDPVDPAVPGLLVTPLAKTSATSWAETDLVGIFKRQAAQFTAQDTKGPVVVADAVEADLAALKRGSGSARLVVIGSTDFANNQNLVNFYNRDFIMNSVDWLAGESNSITIRPRTLRSSRFNLTVDEFDVVFVLSVLLLPELLLIIGIAVWWERRN
ncbi:MAG TPA: Gldg family protein [Candidatus Binataceae bacterium]|nr:Gldg family protein [Candidatus Binataceae bacterium]